MDAQHDVLCLHPLEHRIDPLDISHAAGGIGGCVGGVHLGRGEHAFLRTARQIVRISRVGQIAGHQRFERRTFRHRCTDPVTIRARQIRGGDRRRQVRHHNRAGKLASRIGNHAAHDIPVAKVQMPVIGAADCEALGHGPASRRPRRGFPVQVGAPKWLFPCLRCRTPHRRSPSLPAPRLFPVPGSGAETRSSTT